MRNLVNKIAMLGVAGSLITGAVASQTVAAQAQSALAFSSANSPNFYVNGAYAYETAPASVAAGAQQRGFDSYASVQRRGAPSNDIIDSVGWQERHLNGTE
jgi:hypothetical protein